MATGKPAEVETEGVPDDQSRLRLQTFPVFGQDGTVTAFIEFVEDITERKRAEETLRESEEKYRNLFTHLIDGFALHEIVINEKGEVIGVFQKGNGNAFMRLYKVMP